MSTILLYNIFGANQNTDLTDIVSVKVYAKTIYEVLVR